jgi:nucleotide-binding universal stress UspA family protein
LPDAPARPKADLIVMGRGGGSALRDLVLGSTAERVIRRLTVPVLAVRLAARAPYSRPAIALDFDQAAAHALALLLRVVPDPQPRVLVIHAFDPLFRGRIYTSLSEAAAAAWRAELRQNAARRLGNLLATYFARANVQPGEMPIWKTHIQCGSPRLVVGKAVRKADSDLLVLGTRGLSGITQLFLGTVAGDVLRSVACDVLVVPPRRPRK